VAQYRTFRGQAVAGSAKPDDRPDPRGQLRPDVALEGQELLIRVDGESLQRMPPVAVVGLRERRFLTAEGPEEQDGVRCRPEVLDRVRLRQSLPTGQLLTHHGGRAEDEQRLNRVVRPVHQDEDERDDHRGAERDVRERQPRDATATASTGAGQPRGTGLHATSSGAPGR
jgi:hypothetical protein